MWEGKRKRGLKSNSDFWLEQLVGSGDFYFGKMRGQAGLRCLFNIQVELLYRTLNV